MLSDLSCCYFIIEPELLFLSIPVYSLMIFVVLLFYMRRRVFLTDLITLPIFNFYTGLTLIFLVYLLQFILFIWINSIYSFTFGYSYFTFNPVMYFIIFLVLIIFIATYSGFFELILKAASTPLSIDLFTILLLFANWLLIIFTVTNFFTLVLLIELITINLFATSASLFIITECHKSKQAERLSLQQTFYFFLIFFWSSTIISVLFFFFLLLYSIYSLNFDFMTTLLALVLENTVSQAVRFFFTS